MDASLVEVQRIAYNVRITCPGANSWLYVDPVIRDITQSVLEVFKTVYDHFRAPFLCKDHEPEVWLNRASPIASGLPPGGVKKCRVAFHLAAEMWQCCHRPVPCALHRILCKEHHIQISMIVAVFVSDLLFNKDPINLAIQDPKPGI